MTRPGRKHSRGWPLFAAAFVGLFLLYLAASGALLGFDREFISDSAAHYLTGHMVADFLRSGAFLDPFGYLSTYYEHYPFLGIGLWPPVYYALEGLWMFVFSGSRASMIAYTGAIAATGGLMLFSANWRIGVWSAVLAGCAIVILPEQVATHYALLIDPLVGILMFAAAICFGRYLERPCWRTSLIFAAVATAALLTKGTAVALALLPPAALLLTGRWGVMKRLDFWVMPVLIGLVAGPWYVLTAGLSAQGFRHEPGIAYAVQSLTSNLGFVLENLGPLALALAIFGAVRTLRARSSSIFWHTQASLLVAVFLFQMAVPAAFQARYLYGAYFPLLLFAGAGVAGLSRRLQPAATLVTLASILLLAWWARPPESGIGVREIAAAATGRLSRDNPVILVAGSSAAEGAFAAEIALNAERRAEGAMPFAVRASSLLGGGGYNNFDYVPKFESLSDVLGELDRAAIPLILTERSPQAATWAHNLQLDGLAERHPDRFREEMVVVAPNGRTFILYALSHAEGTTLRETVIRDTSANEMLRSFAGR